MLDIQDLRKLIVSTAFKDATLKQKIGSRFYPAELALIEKPSYPCANFRIDPGQDFDYSISLKDVGISFWIWSAESYDAAYKIYADITRLFHFQTFTNNDLSVRFMEVVPVQEVNFSDGQVVTYGLATRWIAKTIA